jgi:DNA-binding transcriptional MocR family regulator
MTAIELEPSVGLMALRLSLGSTGWFVYEHLILRASNTPTGLEVTVSLRALATELGLDKDTVTRTLRRLRSGRLIEAMPRRHASDATMLRVSTDNLSSADKSSRKPTDASTSPVRQPKARASELRAEASGQLRLL